MMAILEIPYRTLYHTPVNTKLTVTLINKLKILKNEDHKMLNQDFKKLISKRQKLL